MDKNIDYDRQDIKKDRSYITQEIKSEIARQIWGKEQYFRTRLEDDPQFHACISAFPYAERLVLLSIGSQRIK